MPDGEAQDHHPLPSDEHGKITPMLARVRSVPFVCEDTYSVYRAGWDPRKHSFVGLDAEHRVRQAERGARRRFVHVR
jgi:hypothetical protein